MEGPTKAMLEQHKQTHLLKFWDSISPEEQQQLTNDIDTSDMSGMAAAFEKTMRGSPVTPCDTIMKPIPQDNIGKATTSPPTEQMLSWQEKGTALIGENKVALLLLAGGQGSRLGSSLPKGMFDLELPSGSTLYHLQAQRLLKLQGLAKKQYGKDCTIQWYIMTSGATKAATQEFFKSHDWFGLQESQIMFFPQCEIPCFDDNGKFILKTKSSLARSPDGNGGLYRAMTTSGVLDDMVKKGIEGVHVYCVDNILVKVADPMFIGFCRDIGAPAGAKVVPKSHPTEAVGVVCLCNEHYRVVEYSEISQQNAEKRNPDGSLTFAAGNICNHYFTVDFLKKACANEGLLKYHVAHKKIPHVNDVGETVKPSSNNGIKMEKFVFDVFQFADKLAVLEVSRETGFSPLKNKVGAAKCTVEHCRNDLFALHRSYLTQAGVKFVDASGAELDPASLDSSHVCEISPAVTYAGEGLEDIAKANPTMSFPIVINADGSLKC